MVTLDNLEGTNFPVRPLRFMSETQIYPLGVIEIFLGDKNLMLMKILKKMQFYPILAQLGFYLSRTFMIVVKI